VTRRAVDEFVAQPDRCGGALLGRYSVWTSSATGSLVTLSTILMRSRCVTANGGVSAEYGRRLTWRQLIRGSRAMVAATGGPASISTSTDAALDAVADRLAEVFTAATSRRLVAELNEFRPTRSLRML
jgi:hypothetical protein